MKRLTTDNPQDNIETSLNLFYAKDGWTWIRGGGPAPDYADVSLNDFVRMLVKANIPDAELPEDDDDLSDLMYEWLIDDPDSAEGIISLLYTSGWAFAELRHRLSAYEDTGLEPEQIYALQVHPDHAYADHVKQLFPIMERLEKLAEADQQGRLSMQFAVPGQLVYIVERDEDGDAYDVSGYMFFAQVNQTVIVSAFINDIDDLDETLLYHIEETSRAYNTDLSVFPVSDCFLSKVEAERALEGGADHA